MQDEAKATGQSLFQFYKVRLKHSNKQEANPPTMISILQSSIKTKIWSTIRVVKQIFQFYKVRLKRRHRRQPSAPLPFQFYKVRLKQKNLKIHSILTHIFQFYKVRLKPARPPSRGGSTRNFNSTKFD